LSANDFDHTIRKNFARFIILSICFTLLPCFVSSAQGDDYFPPWDFAKQEIKIADPNTELSWPATILKDGVIIFSKYISPIDGDRCNMYPTCAAYSREAVEKYGFVGGLLLTVDRLIHESNEIDRAPRIVKWGKLRFLDPVSNNDFWWYPDP
jgi:hypothetical protein